MTAAPVRPSVGNQLAVVIVNMGPATFQWHGVLLTSELRLPHRYLRTFMNLLLLPTSACVSSPSRGTSSHSLVDFSTRCGTMKMRLGLTPGRDTSVSIALSSTGHCFARYRRRWGCHRFVRILCCSVKFVPTLLYLPKGCHASSIEISTVRHFLEGTTSGSVATWSVLDCFSGRILAYCLSPALLNILQNAHPALLQHPAHSRACCLLAQPEIPPLRSWCSIAMWTSELATDF